MTPSPQSRRWHNPGLHPDQDGSERVAKTTRFVKTAAGDRVLDEAALARAQSLVGLKGYVTNVATTARGRGDRPLLRVMAGRTLISDVQKRPTCPTDVPPHPRRHRSPPHDRRHRSGRGTQHPRTHRPCHRQRRQAAAAPALSDHRHQRDHRDLPTRSPRSPAENSGQPQHPEPGH